MSISDSTVKGKFDELAGKAKQAFGDATGDQSTANSGAVQEVRGDGEQAWGSVKETAHDTSTASTGTYSNAGTTSDNAAHDTRNSVTSAAENVKDHIKNAVEDLKR